MLDIWTLMTIFMLACFVGYFVVWGVTPALYSPLMSVTNAVSAVIIIGAFLSAGTLEMNITKIIGLTAVFLASVNILADLLFHTACF